MPVEMIGWIAPRVSSEVQPPRGPPFSAEVIAATARVHERADFDRVLIGYFSDAPDGFLVGAHAAATTTRLGFLLAHRPGFVSPTLAARKLATLDQLSGGRLAVHIIAGGSDADQAKDGDFTDHAGRYRRVSEYIELLRKHLDVDSTLRPCRRILPRGRCLLRYPLPAEPAYSDLRRRRIERCDPGARAARRPLHAVGRAVARDRGLHGAGRPGGDGCRQVAAALQPVDAADPGRDR